jgi:acetyl-CoA carboxylase, biotin carboxylase subunit
LQMHVAAGEPLPFTQEDVALRGHAIECRIYAEDPDNNFFPSPGKILERRVPTGPGIRLDDGIYGGWTVPNEYDPMLGKLIAWGQDRPETIARMKRALGEYYASGIKTNVSLFRRILTSRDFETGAIYTRWLDDFLKSASAPADAAAQSESQTETRSRNAVLVAALLWHRSHGREVNTPMSGQAAQPLAGSRWRADSRREQVNREPER